MLGTTRRQMGIVMACYRPNVALTPGTPNTVTVNPLGAFVANLHPSAYTHQIEAVGGFWSMSATIEDNVPTLEWLTAELLGAHVAVWDDTSTQIWEGFINTITYQSRGMVFEFGPVVDIINRVQLRYKQIYTGTNPPDVGSTVSSPIYEDTDSQRRWGIRSAIVNAGERTATDVAQCAHALLAQRSKPRPKIRFSTSDAEKPILNLGALGYCQLLSYTPVYVESAAEIDLSVKLANTIDAEPNGLLTAANARIEANTVPVPENDDTYRDAWTVVKNLVQRGTTTYGRTLFMVGPNRRITYGAIPTNVGYVLKAQRAQVVVTEGWTDMVVPEQRVTAGRWAYMAASMNTIHQPLLEDVANDPQALFAERVTFDALTQRIQIDGSGEDNLPAQLQKFELGTTAR